MRIKSIICGLLVILSAFFSIAIFPSLIRKENHFTAPEYKGIITIWQIDSFEGGTGSRKQFLLKVARSYERQNSGLLIMVIDHTFESVKEALNNGEYPDIISYGNGVLLSGIQPLNSSEFFKGGAIDKTIYALPWCRGGYCLIRKGQTEIENGAILDKITLSKTEYNQPALALYLSQFRAKEYVVKSPLDAYVDFVGGKSDYLLGTQRDIIRLSNRGVDFSITPLIEYNDLYQYVSVMAKSDERIYYAKDFINYLLSSKVQQMLKDIGMLSCFEEVNYQSQPLVELQNIKHEYTLSAFSSEKSLAEIHDLALISLKGDKESEIKIKNMLI